jgi:hypothetical protein
MAKKSHRVASRQAEVSKERKRKKKSQTHQQHVMPAGVSTPPSVEGPPEVQATPSPMVIPETSTAPQVTRPAAAAREAAPRYHYVIADLRRTGLLTGAMVIILIVLAFVLG